MKCQWLMRLGGYCYCWWRRSNRDGNKSIRAVSADVGFAINDMSDSEGDTGDANESARGSSIKSKGIGEISLTFNPFSFYLFRLSIRDIRKFKIV
jgi:hypothetical protein